MARIAVTSAAVTCVHPGQDAQPLSRRSIRLTDISDLRLAASGGGGALWRKRS